LKPSWEEVGKNLHNIIPYKEKTPKYHESAYIDASARIIGGVVIGENSGIWPGAILRGDDGDVFVDKNVNIMDKAFLEAPKEKPVIVREGSLISHGAILHGCKIGKHVLVGIGSIILDNAEVGDYCIVAAGSLVPANSKISPRSMVAGVPYKIVRKVTNEETNELQQENANVSMKARTYRAYLLETAKKERVQGPVGEKGKEVLFEIAPESTNETLETTMEKAKNKLERKKKIKFQEIRFDVGDS